MSEAQIVSVRIQSEEAFPVWSLVHYLHQTEITYTKLTIIRRVCDLLSLGYTDDNFQVATESADVFQIGSPVAESFEGFVSFIGKEQHAREFWAKVRRLDRPAVFVRKDHRYIPLYDPTGTEVLGSWRQVFCLHLT